MHIGVKSHGKKHKIGVKQYGSFQAKGVKFYSGKQDYGLLNNLEPKDGHDIYHHHSNSIQTEREPMKFMHFHQKNTENKRHSLIEKHKKHTTKQNKFL